VNVGAYDLFTSLILGNMFHIDTSHWGFWQQTIAVVLITASQGAFNHMGIRTTTRLTDFSGYLIFFIAIVLTIAMLVGAQHYDVSRLFTFINYSARPAAGWCRIAATCSTSSCSGCCCRSTPSPGSTARPTHRKRR
ncbi:unnamed protein product, partial [Acidocella sp. C78]